MNYENFFSAALDKLHQELRSSTFADLERVVGRFPYAIWHSPSGPPTVSLSQETEFSGPETEWPKSPVSPWQSLWRQERG